MKSLPVFFSPRMVAPSQSFSPSAEKPAQVVASWRRLGVPLQFHEPAAASAGQLSLAHQGDFVREVLACERENGFGNRSAAVAASLPFTTGAMLGAARHAWLKGGAAVAPCSGFHHAQWAAAGGFCTFNGLMVTAAVLHAEGARAVGILDLDHHWGDGTQDIIDRLDASSWVEHFSAGLTYSRPSQAADFFKRLPGVLAGFQRCDVVLYQAGADPHVEDPLGGWLTTTQLRERDALVFEAFLRLGVPVAWNLAGGYQRDAAGGILKVLQIHDNTMRECARVFLPGQAVADSAAAQR